ncbi:hypothetical protein ACFO5R_17720 [Halosolutus amylolyticus]|uniref:Small CPxCG-related zinc finger protein n=1 Tax=Halosolutus amylolyticus TaxID=2932267 RepID=A0ABD5PT86_9EURY|nr:hypothetical protein [Halosolutus amylolyticus]
MPASIVCSTCGFEHRIPDRPLDRDRGGTGCPSCGDRGYTVEHSGLRWHP